MAQYILQDPYLYTHWKSIRLPWVELHRTAPSLDKKVCKRNCRDKETNDKMKWSKLPKKISKKLSMTWINWRETFDIVLHNWLLKSHGLYKISPAIYKSLEGSAAKFDTCLLLSHSNGMRWSNNININIEGDCFSQLLICVALIPLTMDLKNTIYGFNLYNKRINPFYKDDLKPFATNGPEQLRLLINVKDIINDNWILALISEL